MKGIAILSSRFDSYAKPWRGYEDIDVGFLDIVLESQVTRLGALLLKRKKVLSPLYQQYGGSFVAEGSLSYGLLCSFTCCKGLLCPL